MNEITKQTAEAISRQNTVVNKFGVRYTKHDNYCPYCEGFGVSFHEIHLGKIFVPMYLRCSDCKGTGQRK